jgi:hypothetical protein
MRHASRHMPKYKHLPIRWWGYLVLVVVVLVLLVAAVRALIASPVPTAAAFVAVAAFAAWLSSTHKRQVDALRGLAAERVGQSICTFAKEFDLRAVDPWVVRAVYEQLQSHLQNVQSQFPIRADDKLVGGLIFDPDDLDMGIVQEIEWRTRRNLERSQSNPFYGKVETVRDLVWFFNAQPKGGITA